MKRPAVAESIRIMCTRAIPLAIFTGGCASYAWHRYHESWRKQVADFYRAEHALISSYEPQSPLTLVAAVMQEVDQATITKQYWESNPEIFQNDGENDSE